MIMKKYRNTRDIKVEGFCIEPENIWEPDSDGDYTVAGYTLYLPASYVEETDHFEEINEPETLSKFMAQKYWGHEESTVKEVAKAISEWILARAKENSFVPYFKDSMAIAIEDLKEILK